MNYPAAELRGIKINFYLINPDAEHRGILLIKNKQNLTLDTRTVRLGLNNFSSVCPAKNIKNQKNLC